MQSLTCFKSYDIRGVVPTELNPNIAFSIGRAFASFLGGGTIVVGHDIRLSGPEITKALADGLQASGVDVIHIGECGSEEIYFAVPHLGAAGGVCVTASHNPANYNGMKFIREGARPISSDNGLLEIKRRAEEGDFTDAAAGSFSTQSIRSAYVQKVLSFTDAAKAKPLKIVANPGNGGAGPVAAAIAEALPYDLVKLQFEPDGTFPNGVPNPLLPENRAATRDAVISSGADMGVAWDGDFDRCFFFDENGDFIEGYYLVSLLARVMLQKFPAETIIYDPRLYWASVETIEAAGGKPQVCKTGHAFIKDKMRETDAIYGGEMSAHHYFRDFYYCDNGNIPWVLIAELIATSGKTLSELVAELIAAYPCSGEINLKVADSSVVLNALETAYSAQAKKVEKIDGIGMEFKDWRFNVRASNTEPLLRINVESRANKALMEEKTAELLSFIKAL